MPVKSSVLFLPMRTKKGLREVTWINGSFYHPYSLTARRRSSSNDQDKLIAQVEELNEHRQSTDEKLEQL